MSELEKEIKEMIALPNEEEWFEFKENWYEPAGIGEYISSLSNVAAMLGRDYAYLLPLRFQPHLTAFDTTA